jgi:HEAT repeats
MVRSYWIGPLFGVLALTGLARCQTTTLAAPAKASDSKERYVTVGDIGKPGQKCRVLKTWTTSNGNPAYQVQALDTGELMTIEESESAALSTPGAVFRPKAMRIFHWGRNAQTSPHGTPEPPPGAIVIAQPIDIHFLRTAPSLAATAPSTVPEKAHGNWPSAFAVKKAGDSAPAPAEKRLTPVAPPVVKNVEPPLLRPAPIVKAPELKTSPWSAKAPDGKAAALVGSSSPRADAKPADSNFWNATTTWKPAVPSPAPAKRAETPAVKTTAKVETTPAQPGDWRESWGKIPAPKSAPIRIEERSVTAAAPKIELPHAMVTADDPLSAPEKFAAMQHAGAGAFGRAPIKETKRPLLAMLAFNQPPPAPKIEEKKPERRAATIPPPPPVPVTPAAAIAPAEIAPPAVVKAAPPAPAQIVPPVTAKVTPPAPVDPAPAVAEVKPEAKPAVPLGMQSVLAVRSPELAPLAPKKPTATSQAQAMGIGADEPNAFTAAPAKGIASAASNGFWAPKKPAAPANPQADATAWRPPSSPAGYAATAPATAAAAPVMQAGYRQEKSSELSQLSVVMRESLYPSQREWAAERLASVDWRRQPQVLDLLMERAKQDPAPTVRAECVRSLGRLKSDAPGVVEAVKSFRSDADPRVRQEADEAFANLAGTTPAWTGTGAPPSR